jgi:4-oxalocrotonate tautomerase
MKRLNRSVGTLPEIPAQYGDLFMPLVQVKVVEGVFSDAQKEEMIRKLTDAMVSIEGDAMREVTWVIVEEVKSGSWGIGGNPITTADVKAMAGGV